MTIPCTPTNSAATLCRMRILLTAHGSWHMGAGMNSPMLLCIQSNLALSTALTLPLETHPWEIHCPTCRMDWITWLFCSQAPPSASQTIGRGQRPSRHTHTSFHRPVTKSTTKRKWKSTSNAIVDTGVQRSACGLDLISALGLSESDLVPTSHSINGATASAMDIAGVLFASISANRATAKQHQRPIIVH